MTHLMAVWVNDSHVTLATPKLQTPIHTLTQVTLTTHMMAWWVGVEVLITPQEKS